MDIKDELDASFGDGPPLRPVTDAITAGRAALRRRRLGAGAAALAVVVVAGGTAYAAVGDQQPSTRGGDRIVATQEPASVDEFLDEVPVGLNLRSCADTDQCAAPVVDYDGDGQLRRAPGVVVRRLVIDPVLRGDAERSAAVEAVHEGTTSWIFLQWMPGGASSSVERPEETRDRDDKPYADFDAWLAAGKAPGGWGGITSGPEPDPDSLEAVEWWDARTGEPAIPDGFEVLRRVDNPLGLTPPHDSMGLVVRHRGTVYWLLTDQQITDGDGGSSASWVEAEDAASPDFESWLADHVAMENGAAPEARERYEGGEGLR